MKTSSLAGRKLQVWQDENWQVGAEREERRRVPFRSKRSLGQLHLLTQLGDLGLAGLHLVHLVHAPAEEMDKITTRPFYRPFQRKVYTPALYKECIGRCGGGGLLVSVCLPLDHLVQGLRSSISTL